MQAPKCLFLPKIGKGISECWRNIQDNSKKTKQTKPALDRVELEQQSFRGEDSGR